MRKATLARFATVAAGGALILGGAMPVAAAEPPTVGLHPNQVGLSAGDFDAECDDRFLAGRAAGEDGWHFVLSAGTGTGFLSLTIVLEGPDGQHTVVIPGNSGFIRQPPPESATRHAYLFTPAGWSLVSGVAQVSGSPADRAKFVVSHTCPGVPTSPSPRPPESTGFPSPAPEQSPTPGQSPAPGESPAPGGGAGLPVTGAAVGGVLAVGAGLIAAGVAMLAVRRRRSLPGMVEEG